MRSQLTHTKHTVEYNGGTLRVSEIENMDANGMSSYLYAAGNAAGIDADLLVEVDENGKYAVVMRGDEFLDVTS